MGEDDLDIFADQMYRLVKRGLRHVVLDQVKKTVLGLVCCSIEIQGETFLEIRVVLHHGLDELHVECIIHKQMLVRYELDKCAVLFL